jgi:hypothetical protein
MSYAASTAVSTDRSQAEIQKTLTKYGAHAFVYGWDDERAIVEFAMNKRRIRFVLPMPDRNSREFTHTAARYQPRTKEQQAAQYDQAVRSKWRALVLVIKAKLEAVESKIVTFDAEFLAHVVLPNGSTVGETVIPGVELAYETEQMPALLANFSSPKASSPKAIEA